MGGQLLNHVHIPLKTLNGYAKVPVYGSAEAVGADLHANFAEITFPKSPEGWSIALKPGERRLIKTGVAIELPPGAEAQVRPRSGLALKNGITVLNSPGTIDPDYRGDIGVLLINHGDVEFEITHGDKIAQLVLAPTLHALFQEEAKLSDSDRGDKGFGSTGV